MTRKGAFLGLGSLAFVCSLLWASVRRLMEREFFRFDPGAILHAMTELGPEQLRYLCFTAAAFALLQALGSALALRLALGRGQRQIGAPRLFFSGFICANALAILLLFALGVPGLYYGATAWAVCVGLAWLLRRELGDSLGIYARGIRRFARKVGRGDPSSLLLSLGLLAGGFPVLVLQLVSPTTPFMDVLEVSSAPVQHVLAFHSYHPSLNNPSALFAANRNFVPYTAFFTLLASLTGQTAVATITAFLLPFFTVLFLGVCGLGTRLHSRALGAAAGWLFFLGFSYQQSQAMRSTTYVFALALAATWLWRDARKRPARARQLAVAGAGFGMAFLAHPLNGAFAISFAALWVALDSLHEGEADLGAIAVGCGSTLTALSVRLVTAAHLPAWVELALFALFVGAGGAATVLAHRALRGKALRLTGPRLLESQGLAFGLASLLLGLCAVRAQYYWMFHSVLTLGPEDHSTLTYGLWGVAALTFLRLLFRRRFDADVVFPVAAFLGTAALVATAIRNFPQGKFFESLSHELYTKMSGHWYPLGCALIAALLLVRLRSWLPGGVLSRHALLAVVPALVIVPQWEVEKFEKNNSRQNKLSEIYGLYLRESATGYWQHWPDWRRLIDADSRRVVTYMNGLVRDGELGAYDQVLHLAPGPLNYQAMPFPVFTGIRQILVNPQDPATDIHALGSNRIQADAFKPARLEYPWILIEDGPEIRGTIARLSLADYETVLEIGRFRFLKLTKGKALELASPAGTAERPSG